MTVVPMAPALRAWLGASRVTVPVYHGTRAPPFTLFHTAPAPVATSKYQLLLGTHFASDRGIAAWYATGVARSLFGKGRGKGRIIHAYLRVVHPLDLTSFDEVPARLIAMLPDAAQRKLDQRNRRTWAFDRSATGKPPLLWMLEHALQVIPPATARAVLEAAGYDGVKYTATYRGYRDTSWIVFHPEQVRVVREEQIG